jgi:hypothetical protein
VAAPARGVRVLVRRAVAGRGVGEPADERAVDSGLAGAFALWLIVLGLALVGVAVLVG